MLLLKAGYEEEVVLAFNRDELMSKYAECLLADPLGIAITRVRMLLVQTSIVTGLVMSTS